MNLRRHSRISSCSSHALSFLTPYRISSLAFGGKFHLAEGPRCFIMVKDGNPSVVAQPPQKYISTSNRRSRDAVSISPRSSAGNALPYRQLLTRRIRRSFGALQSFHQPHPRTPILGETPNSAAGRTRRVSVDARKRSSCFYLLPSLREASSPR